MSFSSAPPEASLSLSYACGSSSNVGFSFFPQFDQTGGNPEKALQSSTEPITNTFSLLCLSPCTNLKFPGGSNTPYSSGAIEIPEKYLWPAGLTRPPRPRADGPFAHSEVFTSRCVHPKSLMIQELRSEKQEDSAFDSGYSAYGKASFLPENWGAQAICGDETGKDSLIKKETHSLRRGFSGKKQPKPQNSSFEPSSDTIEGTLRTPYHLPSRYLEVSVDSANTTKNLEDDVKEKKTDGKYVCDRISKGTGEICGKKFQRSEHLKRHWATHTELKPHQCPICQRSFGRTDNLNQHRKTHDNAHGRNTKLLHAQRLERI